MIRWLPLMLSLAFAGCVSMARVDDALPLSVREHPENFVVVTVRNDMNGVSTRAGSTPRGYERSNYGPSAFARDAVSAIARDYRLDEVSGWPIAELGIHCVVFRVPDSAQVSLMLDRLNHDGRVESAQPLNVFATRSDAYNDPYQDLQSNLNKMGVSRAHQWSRGTGVHIAIVDTGADTRHPDLAGRVVETRNFVDNDANAFARDRHGTAVAGVIAADSNNRIGIVGVAPEAHLHIYKACWQQNAISGAACNTFTLAKGLAAAIDARVQIVNLSLAGPEDALLTRLVARGQQRGLVFVGALSPAPSSAEALTDFPAGIAGVLKVATSESSFAGRDALRAPGTDVLTLAPDGHYDFASGNSLATAAVTGTVALLISQDKKIGPERLQQLLMRSTSERAGIDACAALAALLRQASCTQAVAAE
jgi:subtilisin family serine protease